MLADPQKAQRGGRGACAGQTKAAGGSEEEPGPEASGGSEGSEKYDGGGFTTSFMIANGPGWGERRSCQQHRERFLEAPVSAG